MEGCWEVAEDSRTESYEPLTPPSRKEQDNRETERERERGRKTHQREAQEKKKKPITAWPSRAAGDAALQPPAPRPITPPSHPWVTPQL